MSVLFITAGPLSWASSRLRMFWPAEHMPEASVYVFGDTVPLETFDAAGTVVLQKHGAPSQQAEWRAAGKRVIWDACDPMWWFSPNEVRGILAEVDAVTVSTEALAADLRGWDGYTGAPLYVIPDRLKLEHYPLKRQHSEHNPVRLIWYGVAVNRVCLPAAWAVLDRLSANGYTIELTICDERPDAQLNLGRSFPVYHTEWSLEHENRILSAHDIALLPPYPGPWGRVKSDNKDWLATACGLPVMRGCDYGEAEGLVEFPTERVVTTYEKYDKLLEHDVRLTAADWRKVISDVA